MFTSARVGSETYFEVVVGSGEFHLSHAVRKETRAFNRVDLEQLNIYCIVIFLSSRFNTSASRFVDRSVFTFSLYIHYYLSCNLSSIGKISMSFSVSIFTAVNVTIVTTVTIYSNQQNQESCEIIHYSYIRSSDKIII